MAVVLHTTCVCPCNASRRTLSDGDRRMLRGTGPRAASALAAPSSACNASVLVERRQPVTSSGRVARLSGSRERVADHHERDVGAPTGRRTRCRASSVRAPLNSDVRCGLTRDTVDLERADVLEGGRLRGSRDALI